MSQPKRFDVFSAFRDFLTTLLGGDEEAERTLAEWMKGLILTPEVKPGKAIALVGPPGCGKKSIIRFLRKTLGDGAVLVSNERHRDVWGRHIGLLENALVVCFAADAGSRSWQPSLNTLISDLNIEVTDMYQPRRVVRSCHRVILTSRSAIPGFQPRLDQIQCHLPADEAAAVHFNAFYKMLNQAKPDHLRNAVLSYASYLNSRRRWTTLRAYWRARWIGVYWHALTKKNMAPGGKMAKRDRAAYEADCW